MLRYFYKCLPNNTSHVMNYYDDLIQACGVFDFQVFRSIDSGSVKGFPKYEDEAEAQVSRST